MIPFTKLAIGIAVVIQLTIITVMETDQETVIYSLQSAGLMDSTRSKAFQVLVQKCNVCHVKQNQNKIFSTQNMDDWADEIYDQVFIRKKMPRGKKYKLTDQEYRNLHNWIISNKN